MLLGGARWFIAVGIMLIFVRKDLMREAALLSRRRTYLVLMGFFGFTAYSALFYAAGAHTSGLNLSILLSASPVFTILGAWLVWRGHLGRWGVFGVGLTFVGALALATHGEFASLQSLKFNLGDAFILCACLLHSGYTIALRNRPPVPALVFFTALAIIAALGSLPMIAAEIWAGAIVWPGPVGFATLLYTSLVPTLLAQALYIRGVELAGPHRAGLAYNLVPLLGALMSVMLLGESFAPYHAVALVLILGGIWIAERWGKNGGKNGGKNAGKAGGGKTAG
jgi:drug/metabolite transporter (DMT)-like permease